MSNQRCLSLCSRCCEQKDTTGAQPPRSFDPKFSNSDYVPTDSEVVQWREIMMEEKKELARYKEEIALLRRKLDQLKAGERQLKANIRKCHSALSITRRIPTEIWEMIFSDLCSSLDSYSLDIDFADDSDDSDDDTENSDDDGGDTHLHAITETPPLTLSQVCPRWRNIVHSCPRFWSSISIQLGVSLPVATLLQMYLERSKAHPLSLRLHLSYEDYYEISRRSLAKDKRKALSILTPHLRRCRKLVFGIAEISDFLEVPELAFPKLVSFHCEWIDTERLLTGTRFWEAIRGASQLTDVALRDPLPLTSLPYQQLTTFTAELKHETACVLLRLLPTCTALASLKILDSESAYSHVGRVLTLGNPIEIPSLRHFAIDTGRHYDLPSSETGLLQRWCSKLNLPALDSFSIVCHMGWRSCLPDILQRWATTLRKVTISLPALVNQDEYDRDFLPNILRGLETLDCLTQLELIISRHNDCDTLAPRSLLATLIERLKQEPEGTSFLPKLQSLDLTFSDVGITEITEGLLEVVSSRRGRFAMCPLTRLHFTSCAPYPAERAKLDPNALERLRGLREEGVDIVFGDFR